MKPASTCQWPQCERACEEAVVLGEATTRREKLGRVEPKVLPGTGHGQTQLVRDGLQSKASIRGRKRVDNARAEEGRAYRKPTHAYA